MALPEIELFVVACPRDVRMNEDAIKTSANAENMRLRELTNLVEEALLPRQALVPAQSG